MQMNVMNANMVIISTERSVQVCRVLLFPFSKQDQKLLAVQTQ
jgi:hypothetical protein